MPNSPSPPSGTTCRDGAISTWTPTRVGAMKKAPEPFRIIVVRRYARPRDQAAGRCLRRGQKNSTESAFRRSENVGKSCYFNDLQRLGPSAGVDAGGGQSAAVRIDANFDGERPQRVGERLPPLREHAADHPLEEARRPSARTAGGRKVEADRAPSAPPAAAETRPAESPAACVDVGPPLDSTLSTPYSAVPGLATMRSATSRCSISVASLTRPPRFELEQAEQNRRRDVVGKIAGDANRRIASGGSAASRSMSSTSPATIDAFDGSFGVSVAMRSRSISMATAATLSAPASASECRAQVRSPETHRPAPGRWRRRPCRPRPARESAVRSACGCACIAIRLRRACFAVFGLGPPTSVAIEIALVAHDALVAQRLRFADAPAVQDQRVGRFRPLGGRQRAAELLLDLDGILG